MAMENCSELFCNKSLHGLALRHFDLFGDVSFHFISFPRRQRVQRRSVVSEYITGASRL